ncbi:MAG: hypothetical protein U0T69_01265 [Chitinophagales bacterium]
MQESDIFYKKKVVLDSFKYRVYRNIILFFLVIGIAILISFVKPTHQTSFFIEGSIIFGIICFIISIPVIFITEKKKIAEIIICKDRIAIEYHHYNKILKETIYPLDLKINLIREVSRNGTNYIIELLSKNIKYKIETDRNWTKENIKQIFCRLKEIKNEGITKDEAEILKWIDSKSFFDFS